MAHNYGEPKWHFFFSPSLSWKGKNFGLDMVLQNVL